MAVRLVLVHGQSCCRSLLNFLVRIGERTLNENLQSMMDTEGMTYLGVQMRYEDYYDDHQTRDKLNLFMASLIHVTN